MKRGVPQHLLAFLFLISFPAAAQVDSGSAISVYWQSTRQVDIRGATSVVILDPEIAKAELDHDSIRLQGLSLGETVALVGIDGDERAMIVRVILRPVVLSPAVLGRDLERGFGTAANDAQISRIGGNTDIALRHGFDWMQEAGGDRVSAKFDLAEDTARGMHRFDVRSGSIDYTAPHYGVALFDFGQDLSGNVPGGGASLPYVLSDYVSLRGARVTLAHGRDSFAIFAGTTIPFYFLTLRDTRDVAGVSFHRQQSDALAFFGALSFVRAPDRPGGPRVNSVMQTAGFRYAPASRVAIGMTGGVSNRGSLLRGYGSYVSDAWSAFASAFQSSRDFPLNELQSLFADTKAVRGGVAFGANRRVFENFSYEHTVTDSGLLSIGHAVSDYVNGAIGSRLTPRETLTLVSTYSRTEGGFNAERMTALRYSIALTSMLPRGGNNTAQLQIGSVADPLGLQSQDELSFTDGLSIPIRSGSIYLGYAHNRVNPSLVQKLDRELELLSPELQQLFLANPSGFVANELPPEIRALLESQVPVSDSVTLSFERNFGDRLKAIPSITFSRFVSEPQRGWTHFFGYGLTYQLTPSLLLRSSLSSVWSTTAFQSGLQRSTIVTIGVQKSFTGIPAPFQSVDRTHTIEGLVFRDENMNGICDPGEHGIEGIEVRLDGGAAMTTDRDGRYRFAGVSGELHRLSIDSAQFATPVRMTTLSEQTVDLTSTRRAIVNFGLVDFARIAGSVFNDLRFEGKRQPDSPPIAEVRLLLAREGAPRRTIAMRADGTFSVDDVVPGEYDLSIDPETVPADYSVPVDRVRIHAGATASVSVDFPLRALRSLAGHVYVRSSSGAMTPLEGVQVTVDHTIARTDADGAFVLRDLPAGNLTVTLLPLLPLPANVSVPSGPIHMPPDPIHVEGATIVISNPELVEYLTGSTAAVGGSNNRR